eukprot:scaffold143943_cov20-Prasinocladus_malaysianus.AAC.2
MSPPSWTIDDKNTPLKRTSRVYVSLKPELKKHSHEYPICHVNVVIWAESTAAMSKHSARAEIGGQSVDDN